MRQTMVGMVSLVLMVAGCNGVLPTQKAGGELTVKESMLKTRAMSVLVNAPNTLAGSNGQIVSSPIASVIAAGGGNVIAAGGGNVIAAGGGNVIAAGGGNLLGGPAFRVAAAAAGYAPVASAFVYIEDTLTGKGVGAGYTTDAQGRIQLPRVPDEARALSAIARFSIDGKEYRMAVPLAFGSAAGAVVADPINTVVEGRVRQILRENGKASALSFQQLAAVWTVFNDADVKIDLAALENGRSLEDLFSFYQGLLDQLKAKDADGTKQKVVTDYMATLKAEVK
jgi:hypothetical protein